MIVSGPIVGVPQTLTSKNGSFAPPPRQRARGSAEDKVDSSDPSSADNRDPDFGSRIREVHLFHRQRSE
jgi:hypothetical protein